MTIIHRSHPIEGWGPRPGRVAVTAVLLWALGLLAIPGGDAVAHEAYIGPGAGIALLGSFLAVFSAFISAFFFVLSWPIRMVWRGLRERDPTPRQARRRSSCWASTGWSRP